MTYLLANETIIIVGKYNKESIKELFKEYGGNVRITKDEFNEGLLGMYNQDTEGKILEQELIMGILKKKKRESLIITITNEK